MIRPKPRDCVDDDGVFDAECFAEAIDRYEDERRDDQITDEMDRKEKEDEARSSNEKPSG